MANNFHGNQGIPPMGNPVSVNDILRDILWLNVIQQGPVPSVSYLEIRWRRAYINIRLNELRQTAHRNFWRDIPSTIGIQVLFEMKLADASPSFIIPVQIALSFLPPLVDLTYINMTVTGIQAKWTMRYEYNYGTNNFEFTSGWDAFRAHHLLGIGDYVFCSLARDGNLFLNPMKVAYF